MKARSALLTAMTLAILGLAIAGPDTAARPGPGAGGAPQEASRPARVSCAQPPRLRLVRFEDGSAQLRCGGRILVRISVPG